MTDSWRNHIRENPKQNIDLLDPSGHPPSVFNIVSGKVPDYSVNVHNAVGIRSDCMQRYEERLPAGFHDKINSPVITMAASRKCATIGVTKTCDKDVKSTRTLCVIATGDLDLCQLSFILDDGNMRPTNSKSKLKYLLLVE